jgi:protease I
MNKPLLGQKIAVLVANGFSEKDLTMTQKSLMTAGANVRIVSMDQGLVNSWNEQGWGLNFASDQVINEALAVDYSMLIVPGGQRSVDKLKLTAHTRRFLNGFLNASKPVALFGEAVSLLAFSQKGAGYTVSAPESMSAELVEAGAEYSEAAYTISQSLMTGHVDEADRAEYCEAVVEFMIERGIEEEMESVAA